MYILLPETENRTLEDIERHFSDNSRSITDIKIPRTKSSKANDVEAKPEKMANKGDIVELNNKSPSVITEKNKGQAGRMGKQGCDNKAFNKE